MIPKKIISSISASDKNGLNLKVIFKRICSHIIHAHICSLSKKVITVFTLICFSFVLSSDAQVLPKLTLSLTDTNNPGDVAVALQVLFLITILAPRSINTDTFDLFCQNNCGFVVSQKSTWNPDNATGSGNGWHGPFYDTFYNDAGI